MPLRFEAVCVSFRLRLLQSGLLARVHARVRVCLCVFFRVGSSQAFQPLYPLASCPTPCPDPPK